MTTRERGRSSARWRRVITGYGKAGPAPEAWASRKRPPLTLAFPDDDG
ncbi:hypothetical protein [Actinoplanes regularis]|nr:hypothetical protein [Actinoplanes regularis]